MHKTVGLSLALLCAALSSCATSQSPARPAEPLFPSMSPSVDPSSLTSGPQEGLSAKDMTRPQILSAVPPALTPDAFKFGIKGLMVAKCVITTAGTLQGCRIIKGLPFMNEAVLQVLPLWRFTPPLVRGKPTSVEYVIPIHVQ